MSLRCYGASRGSHSHGHFQVLWSLDGCLDLEVEGRGTQVTTGSGYLINPGERHDFESRSGSRCLVLDTSDPDWAVRQRQPQFQAAADHLARFLALAMQTEAAYSPEYGIYLLGQMWGTTDNAQRPRREIDWPRLTYWVKSRLSLPLTAANLAEQANLSESQFRVRCMAANGCAPMQWIRRLRLEKARLLRASGMAASDVARQTGYASAAAMAAALHRSGKG